jgi:predicted transposase YdaD
LLEKDSFIRSNIFWYLIVLSRIRKLNLIVEQKINAMSTLIQEILKDYPFSPDEPIVQAIGELKRAEGKAEGKAEGIAEGISEVVARFLRAGTLTPEKIAETMDMSVEEVLAIGRRFG